MANKKTADEELDGLIAEQQALMAAMAEFEIKNKAERQAVQKKIDKIVARRRLDALLSPEERELVLGKGN